MQSVQLDHAYRDAMPHQYFPASRNQIPEFPVPRRRADAASSPLRNDGCVLPPQLPVLLHGSPREPQMKKLLVAAEDGFATGDGRGFATGDGRGFATGDGRGFATGDGRGFATGDGRGFATGDGRGFATGDGRGFATVFHPHDEEVATCDDVRTFGKHEGPAALQKPEAALRNPYDFARQYSAMPLSPPDHAWTPQPYGQADYAYQQPFIDYAAYMQYPQQYPQYPPQASYPAQAQYPAQASYPLQAQYPQQYPQYPPQQYPSHESEDYPSPYFAAQQDFKLFHQQHESCQQAAPIRSSKGTVFLPTPPPSMPMANPYNYVPQTTRFVNIDETHCGRPATLWSPGLPHVTSIPVNTQKMSTAWGNPPISKEKQNPSSKWWRFCGSA